MKKKIINHVNLILQIALVFLLFHLNNISMKYYVAPKMKLIINVMIIIHSLMIVRLFIKKHPFTNSIYTIILTVLLIAPLCFELEIKKPTDDMVIDYFMESKYGDEKSYRFSIL